MILLIHQKAQKIVKVLNGEAEIEIKSKTCTAVFWELAGKFPNELIAWCKEEFIDQLNFLEWDEIFHHDLIMASYAVKTPFLPESIGYIDQLPFVNINRKIQYGTWQMSSDTGGIKGEVLLKFKPLFKEIENFDYLLNSIAKIGQQNGLFCYSGPGLIKPVSDEKLKYTATNKQLFSFVYRHYNVIWVSVLLWCYFKYENQFPLLAWFKSFFRKKYFREMVDLSDIDIQSRKKQNFSNSIDVIIPTMARAAYLKQVIEDLSKQTLLPKSVIVVEQNPDPSSKSELETFFSQPWPFEVKHHFIHQTGACNARNMALNEVSSDWVFFCDDDNRINPNILEKTMIEIKRYGIRALNTAYLQPDEKVVFKKVKQWGTFGAGNGFVQGNISKIVAFSPIFEHGYGEDTDFGMQLRNKGCDIIYHPKIKISHLKAPMGGFRKKPELEWGKEEPLPKPSPTLMAYAFRYYTPQQIKGFKTSLFLKFYNKQPIKNPFKYIQEMRKRWKKSEEWGRKLKEGNYR